MAAAEAAACFKRQAIAHTFSEQLSVALGEQ